MSQSLNSTADAVTPTAFGEVAVWEAFRGLRVEGARIHSRLAEYLLERDVLSVPGDTLDLGGGDGELWRAGGETLLARALAAGRLFVTDADAQLVRTCRTAELFRRERVVVERADADCLPYPAGAFARIIVIHVLHWCLTPERVGRAIAEMARVLQPEGRALIVTVDESVHMAEVYQLMNQARDLTQRRGLSRGPRQRPIADMEASLRSVEVRARRAYEWARLRRALLGAAPLALIIGLATLFTTRFLHTGLIGLVLLVVSVATLWWGHGLHRALLPGVLAGTLPLVSALCATRFGHALLGPACLPICYLASFMGGLGSGLIVGSWGFHTPTPLSLVGIASGFGLLTGSMGSSCSGPRGVALLVGGFMLALGAQWVRGAAKRRREAATSLGDDR